MSEEEPSATEASDSDDEFVRLDGAQKRVRDAFFDADSGLFVQTSDPGSGKSTTSEFIAAEYLARKHADDAPAPEETLAVVSFSRDDAAAIAPGIADALGTLARDPECDLALTEADARELGRRVQRASNIGTVDSVLRDLFTAIAREVGFDEVPSVGETADLRNVRAACLEELRRDDRYAARLDRLRRAYPGDGRYRPDAGALLTRAQLACRERQLSVPEFRSRLERVVDETYPTGRPTSFADVRSAVERFVGDDAATEYERHLSRVERDDTVAADGELYDAWTTAVDDLCVLLERYIEVYDEVARREAVASHLDAAHWVARFFADDAFEGDFRERLRTRYIDRLSVVIVDEGQDVSTVQADALAPLVDEDTRVLLVGDSKQLIYLWRNAQPELFQTAIDDGRYFGIDWETHVVEHEQRTRRCRPGIARAVDAVFADVFTDPSRGADSTVSGPYRSLAPTREATGEPNVHVASFASTADSGSPAYVRPDKGVGEADALASCIGTLHEDGTVSTGSDVEPVTVLFHRRTHIEDYTVAFEQAGLAVGNATDPLFAHPAVQLVVEVCQLLTEPDFDDGLRDLLAGSGREPRSVLAETGVPGVLELFDYRVRSVAERQTPDRPVVDVVEGLGRLASRRAQLTAGPVTAAVEAVVDELQLRADPLDLSDDDARLRTAIDALLAHVTQLAARPDLTFDDLVDILERLRADPKDGPTLPLADERSYDVVFKTIFQMKGGEADVVALGDIGGHVGKMGPHADTFSALGAAVALAPPGIDAAATTPALPGFEYGLFDVDRDPWDLDAGLRWASQRWATDGRLAGSPPLSELAHAHRGGRWRLLYVAMTRAREHLVVPLPASRDEPDPRDSWVDTLRAGFEFDGAGPERYDCHAPGGERFQVRVHPTLARSTGEPTTRTHDSAVLAPDDETDGWTPRFVNPSTLYPLLTNPDEHVLDHLQSRALHSEHEGVDDRLALTFETMGPEDVGTVAHDVVATAIRNRESVSTETVRLCEGPLADRLDRSLDELAGIHPDESDKLATFVRETICPQFAESPLWERVQNANRVYVEEPVDMLVRVDGVDLEIQGHADVVLEHPNGNWETHELKVVLQQPEEATVKRYELQAQWYAWGLARQLGSETSVTTSITQLGIDQQTETVHWSETNLRAKLSAVRNLF
ncbi:UvrD-helicase domain-containing protein [Haloarchaeobius sp. TZWWS8]|uniref:UvrD-helicase domain-containing protein n=1 Tax=Haloarchaeobius sp. TZWWS8 TaxID=3446121 RepID=UPI003EB7594F